MVEEFGVCACVYVQVPYTCLAEPLFFVQVVRCVNMYL